MIILSLKFQAFNLRKFIRLIVSCAIPLLVGLLAQFFSGGTELYETIKQPPLSPPAIVFPIVWTILYVLMGFAAFLIYEKGFVKDYVRDALKFYAIQLAVNFIWPIVFFRFEMYLTAFFVLVLLWILVGITTAKFYRISHSAGIIMIPYWLWCTFAAYLNFGVWFLNR